MTSKTNKLLKAIIALLLVASTLVALSGVALADGGKYVLTLKVAPEAAARSGETGVILIVTDDERRPAANVPVSMIVQQMSQQSGRSMGGMQHGSTKVTVQAKPGAKPGEYTASLKLNAEGEWMITAAHDKGSVDFTVNVKGGNAEVTAGNPTATGMPAPPEGAGPASMEAVHASYLDLSLNITDLRSRVDLWQKGDADSQKIALEKLERSEVVIGSIVWPTEMTAAIAKTQEALVPMAKALNASDVKAAQEAVKALGEGSHDVTHTFYGDWLPALEGMRFGQMAPHAIYLDINTNINDLQSRVTQWQKGDESSLNIAKEKVERLGLLLPHMATTGTLLKPVQAIEKNLPAVATALEKKDLAATQQALKPIVDASKDLSRGFYLWMDVTAGATNPTCIQADYLDLSSNISALRAGVDQWQKGDEASLKIAQEKLERTQLILAHSTWPTEMEVAIGKASAAIEPMSKAISTRDATSALAASKPLGDASHDVTHAYYADWLPVAQLWAAEDQVAGTHAGSTTAGGHGSGPVLPSYWFIGSMLGIVVMTITLVPILRKRDMGRQKMGVSGA